MRLRMVICCALAGLGGGVASWIWTSSESAWEDHKTRAFLTGLAIHESVMTGAALPDGVIFQPLADGQSPSDIASATAPGPLLVTQLSFLEPSPRGDPSPLREPDLRILVLSPDLQYPVGALSGAAGPSPAAGFAELARLLASYCSTPRLFLRQEAQPWIEIQAPGVWQCDAAPQDRRLWALVLVLGLAGLLVAQISDSTGGFARLAARLSREDRFRIPEPHPEEGPTELRAIAAGVNHSLTQERDQLAKRALILSGVSHDLGTPATRLRLRTALIEDAALRGKVEADIDRMTEMIESVLTYTRSELDQEPPEWLSLTALVDAIVADYADLDRPVTFEPDSPSAHQPAPRSLFAFNSSMGPSKQRPPEPSEDLHRVLIQARPLALRRALGNLIDNALKYGRRAHVSVSATSERADILVRDEGGHALSDAELEQLTAPFQRGSNAGSTKGVGLGLTIVATIAQQHGGSLRFESHAQGLCAVLSLPRSA